MPALHRTSQRRRAMRRTTRTTLHQASQNDMVLHQSSLTLFAGVGYSQDTPSTLTDIKIGRLVDSVLVTGHLRVSVRGRPCRDERVRMINYTERLSLLMQDIVERVPTLSFIDMTDVLVFARFGRSTAEGAFATCHCLNLPPSEPGYYFWRDRATGQITRRSEWFVTKSPAVVIRGRPIKYL